MSGENKAKILLVDDEEQLVQSMRLQLRKQFAVTTATSGAAGLEALAESGPFAVVVSDMRMPGMNGAEFLAAVRQAHPDTTRILLTGQTDLESAISAINDGQIFRFLTKPVEAEVLVDALNAGVRQFRLVHAERDLLENTLRSSLEVLSDVLGLVNPAAFSCASRVREITDHLCDKLGVQDAWQFKVAAMLSQLGCVALPEDVVDKARRGESLADHERSAFESHPDTAYELISSIPRLEVAGEMVLRQKGGPVDEDQEWDPRKWQPNVLGGEMLRLALAFDRLLPEKGAAGAIEALREDKTFSTRLVNTLNGIKITWMGNEVLYLTVGELEEGMVLQADTKARSGLLLAAKGTRVNVPLLKRLENFARGVGVDEPIEVLTDSSKETKTKNKEVTRVRA